MQIAIKTLGCKANRYESDSLLEALTQNHEVYELNEGARTFVKNFRKADPDYIIVNTCTVTASADRKSRQAVYSFKKTYPKAKIIVFGCSSNVSKEDYEKMKEVDFVSKDREEILKKIRAGEPSEHCEYSVPALHEDSMRTRALIKIQDGCNNYCTYCIIPRARGPETSFPFKQIIAEAKQKEAEGFKEIVLTGIIMSEWKEGKMDLGGLIETLIKNTSKVRFRLSSLEPKNFSEKFFALFKTGRLCPHIHMSLQSGSDSVLKRMRRNYTTAEFAKLCEKFRKAVPDIGLTTDVIVGFPGETEEEFAETLDFAKKVGFLKIHVFPYSKRKNTAAAYMKDQVDENIKKSRAEKLRKISAKLALDFKKSLVGKTYDILVEKGPNNFCNGFTPNYVEVRFPYKDRSAFLNKFVKIKLTKIAKDGVMIGKIAEQD